MMREIVEGLAFGVATGFTLLIPYWVHMGRRASAVKAKANAVAVEQMQREQREENDKRQAEERSIRKWAAGDSSFRDDSLARLEGYCCVTPPLLAVLDRFVADPTSFRCSILLSNAETYRIECLNAQELSDDDGTAVHLYFSANTSQAILFGKKGAIRIPLATSEVLLVVSRRQGKGDDFCNEPIGVYRSKSDSAILVAVSAYGRAVTAKAVPKTKDEEL